MSFDPTDEEEELFPEVNSEVSGDADEPVASAAEKETAEKASKAARKLEPIVLAHVLAAKYQPVKPRVIAKQLKLPSEQHKALKLAIRRLAKAGKIVYGAGHLVRAPQARSAPATKNAQQRGATGRLMPPARREDGSPRQNKNIIVGKFRRTSKGFGFVR